MTERCFLCGLDVVPGWPVTYAYIRMDGGPALPEHNWCALANDDDRWTARQRDLEFRREQYERAAMAVAA